VDYILIIIATVDLDINPNEVRDTKYVSPEELKEMFKQPGTNIFRLFKGGLTDDD
jgi:isopentenyl-diphosphate delta-isomerase